VSEAQKVKLAWAIAAAADLLELAVFPLFIEGALSPVNDVVDVAVAAAMVALLGWHWAFLPTFMAEMVPFVGLVPTWSAAVFLVTRGRVPGGPPGDGPIDVTPPQPRLDGDRGPGR
jgi:hypothetical protein